MLAAGVLDGVVVEGGADGLDVIGGAGDQQGVTGAEGVNGPQDRFGPVRSVRPELVFEIAFEGIRQSSRHKSGVALRFPRIIRLRDDKVRGRGVRSCLQPRSSPVWSCVVAPLPFAGYSRVHDSTGGMGSPRQNVRG